MKSIRFERLKSAFLPVVWGLWTCANATTAMAQGAADTPLGVPQDWSHRHVIHSNPDTLEEAAAKGTLDQWRKKADDPRFVLQLEKRIAKLQAAAAADAEDDAPTTAGRGARKSALATDPRAARDKKQPAPTPTAAAQLHRDWSNVMGGVSGTGDTRTYPAKFSFTTSTKSCTSDFVVFTTSTAGATSTGTVNSRPGTFTGVPVAGETITITNVPYNPNQVLIVTADASLNTGLKFAVGASATEAATNLANAIARNGGTVGATATSSGAVVTLTSMTANVTNANFTSAETLSNFTWGTQTAGTSAAGQPTIFALNQLYADTANGGCQTATQAVPAVYWSYNTGTGAIADLSPVLSFYDNGAQVAFMQRSGTASSLVLLKWAAGAASRVGVPTVPAIAPSAAAYRTCIAPCMLVVPLSGNPNNTNSSPYVDYAGDTLYVGDDTGKLHKFIGLFAGTPAEVVTAPWPVQVAAATSIMSSPVFDSVSQLVFVGSNGPVAATGNKLHSITPSGVVVSSGNIGSASSVNGIRDAPIVDSTAQKVYAFQGADTTALAADSLGNDCGGGGTDTCNSVFQFPTTFAAGDIGPRVFVGLSGANNDLNRAMNSGAFDDAYYSSGNGSLYVCGSQPATARLQTLWKITITNGSFSARTQGPQINNANGTDVCSPVTMFKNGSSEYLYVTVANGGSAAGGGGCTIPASGCTYMYNLTNSSGIIFDNGGVSGDINSAADRFMSVLAGANLNTTETAVDTALTAAQAGTYTAMTISQVAVSPASTTFTYTLRRNATDTVITCSIAAGASACSDTAHTVALAAGDLIDVRVVRTGAGQLNTTIRAQLTATVPWGTATPASAALNANGGTGGIIVDNTLTGGGSQIYFSTRTSPGIAVQASQAGLQ